MLNPWRPILGILLLATSLFAFAGAPRQDADFAPRLATFRSESLPLADVLVELEKQTGSAVQDARSKRMNPKIKLPNAQTSYWQTLDAIGKQTDIGFSTFQPGGGVALVDADYRPLKTHYRGAFRFAFKHTTVSKDEETGVHLCRVTLNVAWEPRFPLLYLNLDEATVRYTTKDREAVREEKLSAQAAKNVAGVCATDVEITMKAPERATRALESVKGTMRALGAPKMLEFTFKKPAGTMKAEQDGVKVTAQIRSKSANLWLVDVTPEHPKKAIPEVESFQELPLRAWLFHRVWLTWTVGKTTHDLLSTGEQDLEKSNGIQYSFKSMPGAPFPPADADVTLHFRTPNRVQTFTVPFVLENLPLP